jgi:hypothetical protein
MLERPPTNALVENQSEPISEPIPIDDRPFLSVEWVTVEGDQLIAGGQSFPLQVIKGVKVSVSIPDSYWRWLLYSFGILFATSVLTGAIVVSAALAASVFQLAAPVWNCLAWGVFIVGIAGSLAAFMYSMRAYPAELLVELDLGEEKRAVYKSRQRENAYAYANRIKRLLTTRR